MRRLWIDMVVLLVLLVVGEAGAGNLTITEDTTIGAGESYGGVDVADPGFGVGPIVIIEGGEIGTFKPENASQVYISGGQMEFLTVESTPVDISGGHIEHTHVMYSKSVLHITGGDFTDNGEGQLGLFHGATAHISGGQFDIVDCGKILPYLPGIGTAHLYGYDFHFEEDAFYEVINQWPGGTQQVWFDLLSGKWADGSGFSMVMSGGLTGTYANITLHEVAPEPVGMVLLGAGAVGMLRRRR